METELQQINLELDEASRCLSLGLDEQGYLHLGTACALLDVLVASVITPAEEMTTAAEPEEMYVEPELELVLSAAA